MTRIHLRQLNFLIANCSTSSKPKKKCMNAYPVRHIDHAFFSNELKNAAIINEPAQQKHSEAQTLDNQYVKMLQI